jgi:hypothetical protein
VTRSALSIACATGHHRVCRDHPTRLCGCRCHDPINQLNDADPAVTGPAESIALCPVIVDRRALRARVQRHRGEHMPTERLDAAGRKITPQQTSGFHKGRPPRNKGRR